MTNNQSQVHKRTYKVSSKKIKDHINFEAKKTVLEGLVEFKKKFEKKEISNVNQKKFSNLAMWTNN